MIDTNTFAGKSQVAPAPRPYSGHIEPAPVTDVLHEQIDYLIEHGAAANAVNCAATCSDCARLRMMRAILLQPFSRNPDAHDWVALSGYISAA